VLSTVLPHSVSERIGRSNAAIISPHTVYDAASKEDFSYVYRGSVI
jgi:hypothetical protein